MADVIIVGAGLFGSIAAALVRRRGGKATVVDGKLPYAASPAAGCVVKPSWLTSLTAQEQTRGYAVLHELYSVRELRFRTLLGLHVTAQHVNPSDILQPPDLIAQVVRVGNGEVVLKTGEILRGKVLVAAGVYCAALLSMPSIRGLYGASIRFRAQLKESIIHTYAPYRQVVAFNINSREVWVGDGTALVERTWKISEEARKQTTLNRAIEHCGKLSLRPFSAAEITVGARPYVEGFKSGYFAQPYSRTWVSTGGAKNGTLLAALQADMFLQEIDR